MTLAELSHHSAHPRIMHTMLRVVDLERSLAFYVGQLGMTLFRREAYPEGRFTLAFVGYGAEGRSAVIELIHNWGRESYDPGTGYGHIALAVRDVAETCARLASRGVNVVRPAGPMTFSSPDRIEPETIAFIEDPDGYRIELIEEPE